ELRGVAQVAQHLQRVAGIIDGRAIDALNDVAVAQPDLVEEAILANGEQAEAGSLTAVEVGYRADLGEQLVHVVECWLDVSAVDGGAPRFGVGCIVVAGAGGGGRGGGGGSGGGPPGGVLGAARGVG